MARPKLDPKLKKLLDSITAKRARAVIDHILSHGHVSTEDLADMGYAHAPRAAREVREYGVPLETFKVTARDGRKIAAYRFGDPNEIKGATFQGRHVFPKQMKDDLGAANGMRCAACGHKYKKRYLQIDHRIPYEISGDDDMENIGAYMLLCGACQRQKSWSCEHCPNWTVRDADTCATCYWADIESHEHVATEKVRRVEVTFTGKQVNPFDRARARLHEQGV